MYIAIDFDGTIVEHDYPDVGRPVPGAIEWMKKFCEAGAKIILWTMRSDSQQSGTTLTDAIEYLKMNGIACFGVNNNPTQQKWTESPKAYANIYIDDAAIGCPLKESPTFGARPFVDWGIVGPLVMEKVAGIKA